MRNRLTLLIIFYAVLICFLQIMSGFQLRLSHTILFLLPLALLERDAVKFLRQWIPFYAVILLYDGFRGIADDLNARVDVWTLIHAERALFGGIIPSVWIQKHFARQIYGWPGTILALFYFGHFILTPGVCFALWRRHEHAFHVTLGSIVLVSILGFMTFVMFPAAPPWMASEMGAIGRISHVILHHLRAFSSGNYLPQLYLQLNPNPVAPMPSLHAAYPFILWLSSLIWFRRYQAVFLINLFLVTVAIVAFGEHYVIDVLAGWIYAAAAFWLLYRGFNRKAAAVVVSCVFLMGMDIVPHREALGTLKDLSDSRAQEEDALRRQEESFQKTLMLIKSGELEPGKSADWLRRRAGEPVSVTQSEGSRAWLYRARNGRGLDTPWIFVYADDKGRIVRWECGHTDC